MVLAAAGQPRLVPLIVVTMHEPSREQEVRDALALFAWGSSQYVKRPVVKACEGVVTRPGPGGTAVTLSAASQLSAIVRRGAAVTRRLAGPALVRERPVHGHRRRQRHLRLRRSDARYGQAARGKGNAVIADALTAMPRL